MSARRARQGGALRRARTALVRWGLGFSVLGLSVLGCGGRSELESWQRADQVPPGEGPSAEPAGSAVEFPSIEETIAVPEPRSAPGTRLQDDGAEDDCLAAATSLDTLLERIVADVQQQPADDRPFLRYVGTESLSASYCSSRRAFDAALDALPLLLNSLSLSDSPARLRAVGAEGLVALDLRELSWDRALRIGERNFDDGWEALAAYAPQAAPLQGPEADALFEQLGTRIALLQVHDLVQAALGAEPYYGLLGVPETLEQLKAALGIPADLEREPNAYWRAVTTRSRVSQQDRLVLRYRGSSSGRLFWRTVDLRPETEHGGAFADPLTGQGDESSVVYTLPNGLPAYFLADGGGRRLNESRVLIDVSERDFIPRTAPSCVRCHSDGGVLPLVDELRPYAAADPNGRFTGAQRALIAEVYPEQSDLDDLIQADARRIADARARAGVPGASSATATVLHAYAVDLRPESAAVELFVSAAELNERRLELPGPVRVLASVGSLDRESFNAVYREALCTLSASWRNRPLHCP